MKNLYVLLISSLLLAGYGCAPDRRDTGDGEVIETYPDFSEEKAELAEEIAFGITELNNMMESYLEQLPTSPDETQEKYQNLIDQYQQFEEELKVLLDEVKQAEESEWPLVEEKVNSMVERLKAYDLDFASDIKHELDDTKK